MIPLRIQLKNFLSYGSRTQTINFEPYHLICLSGKNGHGKSALLDAITWVLWGHARKTGGIAKADEGLVRLGQTNMMVSLDFVSNGNTYRVRREFSYAAQKAFTQLDFGIVDQSGYFKPLTDKTIRDTQSKIDTAVGLNYDSFINSVFLRQGQSNEFSKKSAKERKEILLTILGLTHYEKVRKKALEHIKQITYTKEHYTQLHTKLQDDIRAHELVKTEASLVNTELEALILQESTLLQKKDSLDVFIKNMHDTQTEYELIKYKHAQLTENHQKLCNEFQEIAHTWRITHKKNVLLQKSDFTEQEEILEKEYNEVQEKIALLHTQKETLFKYKEQEQIALQQKQHAHAANVQKIQQQLHILEVKIQSLKTVHEELQKSIIELEAQKAHYLREIAIRASSTNALQKINKDLELHEKKIERRKSFYHTFVTTGNTLKTSLKDILTKKGLAHDERDSFCPLCEQNLSTSRKKFLHTKLSNKEQFIVHQINRLTQVISALKEQLFSDKALLEKLKQEKEQRTAETVEHQRLMHELATIEATIQAKNKDLQEKNQHIQQEDIFLKTVEKSFDTLEREYTESLKTDPILCTLRADIIKLEETTNNQTPLVEKSAQLQLQRNTLKEYRESLKILQKELILQEQRKQQVHALNILIKSVSRELQAHTNELQKYTAHCSQKESLEKELLITQNMLQEIIKKKEELLFKKGSLEQQLHVLDAKEQEFRAQQTLLTEQDLILYEYQAVENALSKDGIQALLIEGALPEIENEANHLLGKLTDNQAHLSLESLRDLKSGNTKETLDIKISDAMGIRPYELFSGGEAFRIDFALRIALSKLLARRAGTSLQTLIIDEGFGSQDEEGLSHIMEALYKIQEDFAKIIIVSHLPTMKDQFPVHFVVHKGPEGSAITVIEQD